MPMDSFNKKQLSCQFISTSTSKDVGLKFAGKEAGKGVLLEIVIEAGTKVLPLYGYFKDTSLTSYEERETYDMEMEVLLPPKGTWEEVGSYTENAIPHLKYIYRSRM